MPNRKTKPTSPGRRFATYPLREPVTASEPERKLTEGLRKSGGRNVNGRVIMYADTMTESMKSAIAETDRRRALQAAYNEEHGITPESVVRAIEDVMSSVYERDYATPPAREAAQMFRTQAELDAEIARLEREMKSAAANLDFERAAAIRIAVSLAQRDQRLHHSTQFLRLRQSGADGFVTQQ